MALNATPSAPHPRVSARKPGGHARERLRPPEIVDRVGSVNEGSADVGGVKSLNWSRRRRVERRGDLRGAASTPAGDSSVGAQCRGRCAEGDVIRILLADDEQLMRTGAAHRGEHRQESGLQYPREDGGSRPNARRANGYRGRLGVRFAPRPSRNYALTLPRKRVHSMAAKVNP